MSLPAFALRLAARQTLLGSTWAGDNVLDTSGLIVETGRDEPQLSIVIETAWVSQRRVCLSLTLALHGRFLIDGENGEAQPAWVVAGADAASERALDILAHQSLDALRNGGGDWGKVLRGLASIESVRHERGEPGVAQRVVVLELEAEGEPAASVNAKWRALLDELDAAGPRLAAEKSAVAVMLGKGAIDSAALGLSVGVGVADAYPKAVAKPKKPRKG